jgi:hypothetical protein
MAASCRRKSSTDASFHSNMRRPTVTRALFVFGYVREQSFTDTAGARYSAVKFAKFHAWIKALI